jgi:hypothetical protein
MKHINLIKCNHKNKGDKKHTCNYRPISLTSVVCKICESLIRDKMMNHLIVNNLLSNLITGKKVKTHTSQGIVKNKCTKPTKEF